jgi:hydrogenase nickel incorporation protein HypA/HybF
VTNYHASVENIMHELGIAEAMLDAISAQAVSYVRVYKVNVRIGEWAGVDPEAFQFCFEVITKGTEFETLVLEIEYCPRRQKCAECEQEFLVKDYDLRCPQCGSERGECIGGDELELAYLEVEDHATVGVGAEGT